MKAVKARLDWMQFNSLSSVSDVVALVELE